MAKVSINEKVEIGGITKTVKEWCVENGRSMSTVRCRVERNRLSLADAITKEPTIDNYDKTGNIEHTIDDVTKTLLEWCREYNIPTKTVKSRLAVGWDVKDALTRPVAKKSGKYDKPITAMHKGEEKTLTIPEWAKIHKCCPSKIHARISSFRWSPERAVTTPVKSREKLITAMYDGELRTLNIDGWSNLTGLPRITINKRVSRGGMTYEEAVSTPLLRHRDKMITAVHDGETKSLLVKEWAELLGCLPCYIYNRIANLGWTPEKAVTTPITRIVDRGIVTAEYNGKTYSLSVDDWLKKTGISRQTFNHRLRSGLSVEDAVSKTRYEHHKLQNCAEGV